MRRIYSPIYRPFFIVTLVLCSLAMIELFALGGMTWRNLQRIKTIKQDIQQGHQLQQLVFDLLNKPHTFALTSPGAAEHKRQAQIDLHRQILKILENQHPAAAEARQSLQELQRLLVSVEQGNQQDQIKVLRLSREVLRQQIQEEERLLDEVYSGSQQELQLAIFIPSVVLLMLLVYGYFYLKRQVIAPVGALEELLSNLVKGERRPIQDFDVDSVMQPLFHNYNQLVTRLSELEEEHRTHTDTLEQEVRQATHTLLEQSHSLARAERLAAVGELAASTAHELRNPLAGIQVALENMYNECNDEELAGRLRMVNQEVRRLTGRLNDLLAYSRQAPEKAKHIDLGKLIDELMTLLKYQIQENITLHHQVEENLGVFLPENELRQALLNLLLNAIQSIADKAGTVNLRVKRQQDRLFFEITDSGAAFPEELLEQGVRLFASYREHGTGLGLPMVQRFAKSQGGKLELKNDSQGHARASLILPYSA